MTADNTKRLRDEKRYAEALELHEEEYAKANDPWQLYWVAYCQQKLGRPEEARQTCEEVVANDPQNRHALGLLGRLIYDLEVREAQHCDTKFIAAVGRIARLADGTDDGRYGPHSRFTPAALHGLKLLAGDARWQELLDRAARIDVTRLSDEQPMIDGRRGWSDRARWHSQVTKALERTFAWAELDEACLLALDDAASLQGPQGDWFTFRRVRALRHLERTDDALSLLTPLVSRPRAEPSFLGEMADLLAQRGEPQAALSYFGQALLARAPGGVRIALLAAVQGLLKERGDRALATRHAQLETTVRAAEGWPTKGLALAPGEAKALQLELRLVWQSWADLAVEWTRGSIRSVLPNGTDGFIRSTTGADFYFSLRDIEGRRAVAPGDLVDFVAGERFDKKRNEMRPAASRVRMQQTESVAERTLCDVESSHGLTELDVLIDEPLEHTAASSPGLADTTV